MKTTIQNLMLRAMPDCDDVRDASWRLIHGSPMQLREQIALKSHLRACPCCRSQHKHLKWLHEGVVSNLSPSRATLGSG